MRVVHPSLLKPAGIVKLAGRALNLLASWGLDTGHAADTLAGRLRLEGSYLGEGYGFTTSVAAAALELITELTGISLEGCYTGKAPVSYTHLDVYKRQVLYRSPLCSPRHSGPAYVDSQAVGCL